MVLSNYKTKTQALTTAMGVRSNSITATSVASTTRGFEASIASLSARVATGTCTVNDAVDLLLTWLVAYTAEVKTAVSSACAEDMSATGAHTAAKTEHE